MHYEVQVMFLYCFAIESMNEFHAYKYNLFYYIAEHVSTEQ